MFILLALGLDPVFGRLYLIMLSQKDSLFVPSLPITHVYGLSASAVGC